ncbi:MAG: hypothetical protein ABW032_04710 [Burkholderiaceae bacterium]
MLTVGWLRSALDKANAGREHSDQVFAAAVVAEQTGKPLSMVADRLLQVGMREIRPHLEALRSESLLVDESLASAASLRHALS